MRERQGRAPVTNYVDRPPGGGAGAGHAGRSSGARLAARRQRRDGRRARRRSTTAAPRRLPSLSQTLVDALVAAARAGGLRAGARAARGPRRGAVGDRRPHPALQLAVPERRAAQGNQARDAQRLAAVAALHRSRRVQAHQRRARPPARQPGAHRGGRRHPRRAPGKRTSSPGSAATSSPSSCRKPAIEGAQSVARRLRDRIQRLRLPGRSRPGQPADGLDWGSDPARCRRYSRRAAPGGRCGDVSCEGHRARTASTSPGRENDGARVADKRNRSCIDAFDRFFRCSPATSPSTSAPPIPASTPAARASSSTSPPSSPSTRSPAASRRSARKRRRCSAARRATSSPSSR